MRAIGNIVVDENRAQRKSMPHYTFISNSFPGGLFQYVRVVSLYDESRFESEFFFRIAHSFPLMKKLRLVNQKLQNHKQHQESQKNNRNFCPIEYSCLSDLLFGDVHDDFV